MDFIKKHRLLIVFTLLGMAGGFLYWKFVGCLSGSCPIKSLWYMSTLFGGLIGYLTSSIIGDLIDKFRKKENSGQ
jgi:hypothetical protein